MTTSASHRKTADSPYDNPTDNPKGLATTLQHSWAALATDQKVLVAGLAAADVAGKALALRDLAGAKPRKVRGPKWLWAPTILAVNTLGWAAYFLLGKKRK